MKLEEFKNNQVATWPLAFTLIFTILSYPAFNDTVYYLFTDPTEILLSFTFFFGALLVQIVNVAVLLTQIRRESNDSRKKWLSLGCIIDNLYLSTIQVIGVISLGSSHISGLYFLLMITFLYLGLSLFLYYMDTMQKPKEGYSNNSMWKIPLKQLDWLGFQEADFSWPKKAKPFLKLRSLKLFLRELWSKQVYGNRPK